MSILQTELFQVCSYLGNLHVIEPSLHLDLLNHGDVRGTRHGARDSRANSSVQARGGRSQGGGAEVEFFVEFYK